MSSAIFRFAPSPNGYLHLGHALSALINRRMADQVGGELLLRIDDIDLARARPEFERAIIEDLEWLGIGFSSHVRRQSDCLADYRSALDSLRDDELVYPAFMSRTDVRNHITDQELNGQDWPRDPDGAPLYPGLDKKLSEKERRRRIEDGAAYSWRLDMEAVVDRLGIRLSWQEEGHGPEGQTGCVGASPQQWGDVVLARRDAPASYHLSVVVDDAVQGVTHVVRGRDLFHATGLHRLLQELLGFSAPSYHHHRLVLGPDGRKLSKSRDDTALRALRTSGATPPDIARMTGFDLEDA